MAGDDPLSIEEVIGERDETASESDNRLEGYNLKLNTPCTFNQELECLHKKVVSEATDLTVDLLENLSVIGNFKADSMMNEEKVNAPQDCKWELKNQVVNLQREKSDQLEENMVSGIHYQASINKSLSTKSLQTKTEQYEHEVHLSETLNYKKNM